MLLFAGVLLKVLFAGVLLKYLIKEKYGYINMDMEILESQFKGNFRHKEIDFQLILQRHVPAWFQSQLQVDDRVENSETVPVVRVSCV